MKLDCYNSVKDKYDTESMIKTFKEAITKAYKNI